MQNRTLLLITILMLLSTAVFGQSSSGVLTGNVTTEGAPLPG